MSLSAKRAPRALLVTLLAICAATVVAACGSSSSSSSSSASAGATGAGGSAQFSKYQTCLKSHGVTISFHRPAGATGATGATGHFGPPSGATGSTGRFTPPKGGFKGGGPGGGGFRARVSKKDRAALKACASDAPKGGFGGGFRRGPGGATGRAGAQFSAATLKKFASCVKAHGYTLPKANTSGNGPIYPRKIETDKKFQTASRSCSALLRPSGTGSSGSGT